MQENFTVKLVEGVAWAWNMFHFSLSKFSKPGVLDRWDILIEVFKESMFLAVTRRICWYIQGTHSSFELQPLAHMVSSNSYAFKRYSTILFSMKSSVDLKHIPFPLLDVFQCQIIFLWSSYSMFSLSFFNHLHTWMGGETHVEGAGNMPAQASEKMPSWQQYECVFRFQQLCLKGIDSQLVHNFRPHRYLWIRTLQPTANEKQQCWSESWRDMMRVDMMRLDKKRICASKLESNMLNEQEKDLSSANRPNSYLTADVACDLH